MHFGVFFLENPRFWPDTKVLTLSGFAIYCERKVGISYSSSVAMAVLVFRFNNTFQLNTYRAGLRYVRTLILA